MKLEMAANQVLKQFSRQIRKEDALREVEKWVGTSDSNSTVLSASAPMRRTLSVAFRPQKNVILPSLESRWSRFGLSTRHQSRRSCSNFGESMT